MKHEMSFRVQNIPPSVPVPSQLNILPTGIKYAFQFSTILAKTAFALINISSVSRECRNVGPHAKYSLLIFNFNQNWSRSIHLSLIP